MTHRKRKSINQRQKYRNKKKLNVKKLLIKVAIGLVVITILILIQGYYLVNKHNTIRKTVENNSTTTYAKVINRATGLHVAVNFATYKFTVNDRVYEGETYGSYDGDIGDKIPVKYSNANPEINICFYDIAPETFVDDVLKDTLILMIEILSIPGSLILIGAIFLWVDKRKHEKYEQMKNDQQLKRKTPSP